MALFPVPTLNTHDQRYPDASPVVGGPYMQGYVPVSSNLMAMPGCNTVPGSKALFDAVAISTIQGEESSGDQPGISTSYKTEDHASIPQMN